MKENRVEFRTSDLEREQFEKAASYLGMNLSAFLRMAALERSSVVIKSGHSMMFSNADGDLFLEALENPPQLNQAMKKAIKRYKRTADG